MRAVWLVLVMLLTGVSGCVGAQTEPAVSRSPTFRCTTGDPLSAGPCSEADWQAQQAEDALFQEAVAVYTRFFTENQRIERAGGVTEPTPELLATLDEPMLTKTMDFYRFQHDRKDVISGELTTLSTFRTPHRDEGAEVAIRACEDNRKVVVTSATGEDLSVPSVIVSRVQFHRVDGTLKAYDWHGTRRDTCYDN